MNKKTIFIIIVAAVALITTGCSSIDYMARPSYVGFYSEGAKSVKQTKKTDYKSDELVQTFDDEFVYDEDGNIIKHTQTQYHQGTLGFDEFVMTYQKIGGVVLPESAAVNGVVYMEVEYDLLPVDHEGRIPEYTSVPVYYRKLFNIMMLQPMQDRWTMDIENFDMPFRVDGKYIVSEESFDYYYGFDSDSVLTTGYDNILLQRFYFSNAKLDEGLGIPSSSISTGLFGINRMISEETTFNFKWDVKADKLIHDGVEVIEVFRSGLVMNFNVEREFDSQARLTSEEWTVYDSKHGEEKMKTLYRQELAY
ncbi:MAG: hypothetical protein PQJ61_10870 [Spirochaetales bacterium]|uniref:Lipoprotein n=1 Tax=Candidatus Thalassospirochaeta sargassi TaxID=3119039 RepID=A0AAJ1MKY0_9SPIO|nr:hypothetical protein [Spirochaetales bacterium]